MPATDFQHGVADARYEERSGSGYSPSRYINLNRRLDYIAGYLSVNPTHSQALADQKRIKASMTIVVDQPLNYEADGNILFAPESARRRAR